MAQSTHSQIEKLQRQYTENPGSRVFVYLAEAYRKAGDLGRAHEVLAQGLAKHRNYLSGLVVLARVYGDQGEDAKAEGVWRDVIRLDPENVVALRALGDLAEASGRREEAMEFYRRVVRLENAEPAAGAEDEDGWETDAIVTPFSYDEESEPADAGVDFGAPAGAAAFDASVEIPGLIRTERWDEPLEEPAAPAGADAEPPVAEAAPDAPVQSEEEVWWEPGDPDEVDEEVAAFFADAPAEPEAEVTASEAEAEPFEAPVAEAEPEPEAVVEVEPEAAAPEAAEPEAAEPPVIDEAPEPVTTGGVTAGTPAEAPAARREALDAGYDARALRLWAAEQDRVPADAAAGKGWGSAAALSEMLVRLLEQDGHAFQAGSSLRKLLAVGIGTELDLDPARLDALALASVLGSLGDGRPADGDASGNRLAVTLQLLAEVPLPGGVREAVAAQHERWDGSGAQGLREDQIPLLARVLAVSRAAAALLAASPDVPAAMDELQRQAGSVFDPVLVSVLRRVFAQRERHGIGYGWAGRVAVAHPHELRALDIAARLHADGYAVETSGTGSALKERLRAGVPQALVVAADLPDSDAAALIREVRSVPALTVLPVVAIDAADPARRVALLAAGADLCFGPEVDYAEFKASLDALLRRYEAAAARARPARRLLTATTA